jgi:hypothetical protein
MWLIYALGGGWGHLTRAAALARYARCPVRILTNSPYAAFVSGLDICAIDPALGREHTSRAVLDEIERVQPSLLIIDTFPRGLGGELGHHTNSAPRVLVQRDVDELFKTKTAGYVLSNFDTVLNPGEGPLYPNSILTAPWLIRDNFPPSPRETVLIVAGGNHDELSWYGQVAAALDLPLRCIAPELPPGCPPRYWVREWPAIEWINRARLVIGGAGYNTVHECAALNVPLVAKPWPRKYDRQFLRARRADACVETVSEAVTAVHNLLNREPPPPVFKFENGAAQAAELLLLQFPG